MSRGGSFNPLCEIYITSLNFNSTANTLPPTRSITNFITTHTPILADRVVVSFYSPDPCMVGFGGETKGDGRADIHLN
ncbi:hypothetical protein Pmani_035292 [Petrolisthes manimaculis]|uniref:Uncharacterized protein n=1 Tax=Petrolisthes manimaculis TaxID=1843537 RepID=A0AAE1NN60_9EUCA|nr:hypothetical protein Pmani_035292 [Petrolisthes manimaculis]